ncbi:MAG: hypothetical protein V4569_02775 [Pseudomonadota bacterium]
MNFHITLRHSLIAASIALLAACGGGGSSEPAGGGAPTGGQSAPPPAAQSFTLALSTPKALILQGTSVTVDATVTRSAGFDAAIDLAVIGLPTGVTAAPVRIAQGASSVTLTLSAEVAAPHSLPTAANVTGSSGALSAQQGVTVTVRGPAGALDTSFGSAGKAVTAVGPTDDYAQAMVVQPDGKIVVAGWGNGALGYAFEIVRYERDGALDISFGTAGKVITSVGDGADAANAIALQADGKILVAGSADETPKGKSFALVRYNADGSVDTTFGSAGKVITSFGSDSDEAFAIVVQPDGRIVLGGHTRSATRGIDFALARYNADGSADASFGVNGQVVTPIGGGDRRDSIYALALQTLDGEVKIVAAGGEGDFVLTRYHADGSVDSGFAVGERPDGEFGSVIGAARGLAIAPDNKIVVVGHVGHDVAVLRLNADGLADNGFGGSGRVVTKVSATNWNEAQAVVVQADGRIVVGGWVYAGNSSSGDHVVARYLTDGTLDAGFGNAGLTITPVAPGTKADEGRAIVLQADDRLPAVRSLVAGSANDSNQDFAVTRYWH